MVREAVNEILRASQLVCLPSGERMLELLMGCKTDIVNLSFCSRPMELQQKSKSKRAEYFTNCHRCQVLYHTRPPNMVLSNREMAWGCSNVVRGRQSDPLHEAVDDAPLELVGERGPPHHHSHRC